MKNQNIYNPVVAHRGAWKTLRHPENSIAALKQAIQLKCQGSEFDIHITQDNILVVNHDDNINGKMIESYTYEELSTTLLSNGEKLPLLEDYLKTGKRTVKKTKLILEIKPSVNGKAKGEFIAEQVYQLVKKLNLINKVSYISFDIDILKKLILLDPVVDTQYLNGELSPSELKALGIKGMDYHFTVFKEKNPHWVPEAKKLGIDLNVWTVNTQDDLLYFMNLGFDQITTNEPELLIKLLGEKVK